MRNVLEELKEKESQLQPVQKERGLPRMKNINDVLKEKESQLQQVQKEVEALKLTLRLLAEDTNNGETADTGLVGSGIVLGTKPDEGTSEFTRSKRFP